MKNKALSFLRKNLFWTILISVFALGGFLRAYHFSDWLHFELDQSRDAKVVDLAISEGAENLPLLGPKAAGTFLRLGPAFYYLEYLSARIFGNTPDGIAFIFLLISSAAIPLFYFFLRRYFEKSVSLGLAAVFSVSFFLVMYSRFAWNPNTIPFFLLLAFYSLLRAADFEERKKGFWLLVFSFALAIVTQLHFLAFLAAPVIAAAFLLIKRPRIKPVYWLSAFLVILVFYLPLIVNDLKTGGDNVREFMKSVSGKSQEGNYTPVEKFFRDASENAVGHFLILSGQEKTELPRLRNDSAGRLDLKCDAECRAGLPWGAVSLALFLGGFWLLAKKTFKSGGGAKKDFLLLSGLWFLVSFGLFFPIAFDVSPRFFLLIFGLPFIFLGLIFDFLRHYFSKNNLGFYLMVAAIFTLVGLNLSSLKERFSQLEKAPKSAFAIGADRILKENTRVTLKQQRLIADYMEEKYRTNKFPVYVNSEAYYRRSFLYHLEQKEIPRDDFRNTGKNVYQNGNYFLIYPTLSNLNSKTEKYLTNYSITETKKFGTLTVFCLVPKKEAVNAAEQEFGPKGKPKSAPGVPVRYRWEEIFSDSEKDERE